MRAEAAHAARKSPGKSPTSQGFCGKTCACATAYAASVFFHPDCTVGFGVSPNLPPQRLAGCTASGESHPALKTSMRLASTVRPCRACVNTESRTFLGGGRWAGPRAGGGRARNAPSATARLPTIGRTQAKRASLYRFAVCTCHRRKMTCAFPQVRRLPQIVRRLRPAKIYTGKASGGSIARSPVTSLRRRDVRARTRLLRPAT